MFCLSTSALASKAEDIFADEAAAAGAGDGASFGSMVVRDARMG